MAFGTTWKNEILDQILNNAAAPAVSTPYVALHTGDPGSTGANEVTGGGYGRVGGSFGTPSGGTCSNDATVDFTNMPSATLTHVSIWDASTAGNMIVGGALTTSKTTNSGDTFRMATGDLDVTLT